MTAAAAVPAPPAAKLLGDLRERADGGFDGWCWAPDRPDERLVVDLMINGTVAASMVAAIFRRDLQNAGHGDGRHGFALRLPPNLPEAASECLITARERRSGAIFGRVLRAGRGAEPEGGRRVQDAERTVADAWQALARTRAAAPADPPGTRLRAAFGALGERLAAGPRAVPPFVPRPLRLTALADGPRPVLPDLATPALSLVMPVRRAAVALRQLAALAAAAALAGVEIIAVDTGEDPFAALLPAWVRNLRYLRDARATDAARACNLAATHARGDHLLVLAACPEEPSAAALLGMARAAAAFPRSLLLGPSAVAAGERVGAPPVPLATVLPGRLGVAFCVGRRHWTEIGPLEPALQDGSALECADLAFRAWLVGIPVLAVGEPAPAPGTAVAAPVAPLPARRALAAFHGRWGGTAGLLDQRPRPA